VDFCLKSYETRHLARNVCWSGLIRSFRGGSLSLQMLGVWRQNSASGGLQLSAIFTIFQQNKAF